MQDVHDSAVSNNGSEELASWVQQQIQNATAGFQNQIQHLQATIEANTAVANAAATAATNAATGMARSSPVKPAKPHYYSGARGSDPNAWLYAFERYCKLCNVPLILWVDLASCYLESHAATWWQSIVTTAQATGLPLPTWDEFKLKLKAQFEAVNSAKIARDRLAELKQTGSVDKYSADFLRLCLEAGDVGEAEKLDRFLRGLKPAVRVEVELTRPSNITTAMANAQRTDSIMWYASKGSVNNHSSNRPTQQYVPMELNAIEKQQPESDQGLHAMFNRFARPPRERHAPPMSREEYDRCRQAGLCLKCKKPGHTARFCTASLLSSGPRNSNNNRPRPSGNGSAR
jgi:hypothetical protein